MDAFPCSVEWDCGHVMDVDVHYTVCPACGTDHKPVVGDVAGRHLAYEIVHPWHPDYEAWMRFKESHTEYENWLEANASRK